MLDGTVKATGEIEPFDVLVAVGSAHERQARIKVLQMGRRHLGSS